MPKISLLHVSGNSYICSGVLSIGVYLQGNSAVLIDSGGDKSCAKNVNNMLKEAGYAVQAIINTHCHPDHCGGNAFFQRKYPRIRIYATYDEQRFIEDCSLAPRCFSSLAQPVAGLLNKYIAPQEPSVVTDVIAPYCDQTIMVNNEPFKIISLPGHTPGSIGVITPDGILYAGDALFGDETFRKHALLFYTNIENTLMSLKKLGALQMDTCVLYHGGVVKNLAQVAEQHSVRILEIKETILGFVRNNPLSIDQITQKTIQHYNIPTNIISFTLTATTIRAYLAQLEQEKSIAFSVYEGMLQVTQI